MKRVFYAIVGIVIALGMAACTQPWLESLEAGESVPADYGDVILVLGGGLRPKLNFGYSTAERLKLAVALYRQTPRSVIVSDGSLYRGSPAVPVMKNWLTHQGIAPEHIILEGRSQNTMENLTHGLELVNSLGFRQVIACTSPYHQARVKMIMRHLGYNDFRIARMHTSEIRLNSGVRQWLRNLRLLAREYLAILRFRLSGSPSP
ncbi:MAG: YdcF family protein [Candidatus Aminicenantes bacterium]|nr:YdcF family protein [Candidatus Aminicenantes bacterium]